MSVENVPNDLRTKDAFHHIDMGFLNRRLALRALPRPVADYYRENAKVGSDHFTQLANDHLLVTILEDVCENQGVPTLLEALEGGTARSMFRSTEKLAPCPEIYNAKRVEHEVQVLLSFDMPVVIAYHTSHMVSDTGTMTLAKGSAEGAARGWQLCIERP